MSTRSDRFQSLALGAMLAMGAGVAWAIVCGWATDVVHGIVTPPDAFESVVFLPDGTPIIESQVGGNNAVRSFRSLDGKPLTVNDSHLQSFTMLVGPPRKEEEFRNLQWPQRITYLYGDWLAPENWYFVHDGQLKGHGYFVGYDKSARLRVGYLGCHGFRLDEPPLEDQFPVDGRRVRWGATGAILNQYGAGSWPQVPKYLLADDGLMQIDTKNRAVKAVWTGTDAISAALTQRHEQTAEETASQIEASRAILIRLADRVLVLDRSGKEAASYPLPEEFRKDILSWLLLPDNVVAVEKDKDLLWIKMAGEIVRRTHVDLHEMRKESAAAAATMGSIIAPVPSLVVGVYVCYPWAANVPDWVSYSDALPRALHNAWPAFVISPMLSVVLAWLCYRRQRKFGLPWTPAWVVLVLLFGLPVYFGYLAHRIWPGRLPCPHCGRLAPRDRSACFACGQEFPVPAMKGTEVFA